MTLRFSSGGRRPSATPRFQPPAYQAQPTPFADSVSPIVAARCGRTGAFQVLLPAGSAGSRSPPAPGPPRGAARGARPGAFWVLLRGGGASSTSPPAAGATPLG